MVKNMNKLFTIVFVIVFADLTTSIENFDGIKDDKVKQVNSSGVILPPLEFPDEKSNFNIVPPNEATIKRLQHMDLKDASKAKSPPIPEIQKIYMNNQGVALFRVKNMDIDHVPDVFPGNVEQFKESNLKDQFEEIQEDDLIKEVQIEERFGHKKNGVQEIFNEDIEVHNVNINNHHLTIILATFLGLICLAVYIALLTWRQYLTKRYGTRQRLVSEEDADDMEIEQKTTFAV